MGKSFNDEERNFYSRQIYNVAEKLFSYKGFQKTTIDLITNQVGIAKGSFYSFYSSKESLFFRIFMDRELEKDKILIEQLRIKSKTMDFIDAMVESVESGIEALKNDSFMRNIFNQELMVVIWNKIESNLQQESIINDQRKLEEQLMIAKEYGYSIKVTIEVYAEVIRLLVFSLLRNIISEEYDREVGKILIRGTINELFFKN
jgi:AcrR family transcriptional regulator